MKQLMSPGFELGDLLELHRRHDTGWTVTAPHPGRHCRVRACPDRRTGQGGPGTGEGARSAPRAASPIPAAPLARPRAHRAAGCGSMGRVEVDRGPPAQRCLRRRALCDTLDSATGEAALPTRVCFASLAVGLVGPPRARAIATADPTDDPRHVRILHRPDPPMVPRVSPEQPGILPQTVPRGRQAPQTHTFLEIFPAEVRLPE